MLRLTRRVAGGRAKQRLPRSLQGLSTPNMRRSWWDMKNLSSAEKRELLCGSWRAANPIRLVPGPSSRVSCSESEPLTFATEEAADHYMAEEDKDVASETHESTLALAERFFVELASAADGEVDGAQMPQDPQSDDERRREMRDVQREFFGDFYVEQGIVDESSRYAFVDTMLRPSRPLFLVNAVLPLARLTVRDQLESHCAVSPNLDGGPPSATSTGVAGVPLLLPVFTPTLFNPCLYAIPLPPTQTFGAPLHVSFSAASSRLNHVKHHDEDPSQGVDGSASSALVLEEAPNSAGEQKLLSSSGTSVDLVADADELRAMMLDALPCSEADSLPSPTAGQSASMRDPGREAGVTGDNTAVSAPAVSAVAPNPATKPPSLAHMYWLQRQVASDTLLNVDDVSVVVSLLSVRLAAFSMARGGASQPYEVILCQANDRDATACAYHTEIAQYLFQAAQEESSDPAATDRLARVVIAVEDVTLNGRPAASPHSLKENRDGSRRQRRPTHQTPLPCTESAVPVMDRYPNMVYLQPPLPRVRGRPGAPLRGDLDSRSAPAAAHIPSRVVLCMPATSRDGVRPRGWLAGTEHEAVDEDADLSPFAADDAWCPRRGALSVLSGAPPNTFVERCRMANANFSKLREQLYDAIHTVRVDGCGWVIYATQSANVIENEAVVCAVLQRIREEGDIRQPPLPRDSSAAADGDKIDDSAGVSKQVESTLSVECVPLDSPTIEACMASPEAASVLGLLCSEGRRGLSTWVAIKDGAAGQEAEQISAELRASVARAAWRTDPMRSGSDGGFVVCLRVARPRAFLRHQHGGIGETVARGPPRLCRWWTHPRSRVVSAVTPAALRFITDAERGDAAGQGHASKGASRILHAGVPVGYVPTLPEVSATGSDDVPSAPGLPVDCRISSAICHVDALGALRRSLPPLALPAKALCELLLVRHIDSRVLRRQLRLCQKQSTIQRRRELDVEGCATDVEAETRAFLGAVERVAEAHLASTLSSAKLPSRFYAWVGVVADSLLPSGEICFDPQATESSEAPAATGSAALDSAVLTEVKAAGVVVEVECSRYPSSCDSSSSHMEFSVRLDVPPDMPERFKHLAALEEWRVALRDALLYVRRRTTKESSPFRLWADQSINHTRVPAPRFAAGRASGAMSVPRSGELVELAEDEYESLHTTRMVPTLGAASLPPVRDTPCNV
ncbi:hypothetical protein JKF63_02724 [Porcisia hertigi]|uniref:Uncharacterized protein n=1 Tax=Porcisia hertigi TaxID=2761500 RepID=A0A836HA21_9TRYP|nr:hypothetical protein JKF63_02724 [Porcisia hertigi]